MALATKNANQIAHASFLHSFAKRTRMSQCIVKIRIMEKKGNRDVLYPKARSLNGTLYGIEVGGEGNFPAN